MDDAEVILYGAEEEGYSMLTHLRPGDRYLDKLVRRLDDSKGGWVTIVKFLSDGSEYRLGHRHKDRTCWVVVTTDDNRESTLCRPVFNLYLAELNNPDSIAALQQRHAAPGL